MAEVKTIKAPLNDKKLAKLADSDGNITFRLEVEIGELINEEDVENHAADALREGGNTQIQEFEWKAIELKKKGTVLVLECSGNVSDYLPKEEAEGGTEHTD